MMIDLVWQRLAKVQRLSFQATSSIPNGWNGSGSGTVEVDCPNEDTLLFHESGRWSTAEGKQLSFSNVYRWSRAADSPIIRLEHLRFGHERPVYLFALALVDGQKKLTSVEPHVCGADLYSAQLVVTDTQLNLDWSVTGPNKNESIEYVYS